MKVFHRLFTFFSLCLLSLNAKIIEVKNFSEINEHIKPDTLIIYDIDNTLIHLAQSLGGDTWFQNHKTMLMNQGFTFEQALDLTLDKWIRVQSVSATSLVENTAPAIISHYQEKGNSTMALTTRGFSMGRQTVRQLHGVNIDFESASLSKMPVSFNNLIRFTGEPVIFYKGILFTAGSHKGAALFEFLNRINLQPTHILFINDKQQNIEEVEEYCTMHNVPFIGLRYGYLDASVESFNMNITRIQDHFFGKILSDIEALEVIESFEQFSY